MSLKSVITSIFGSVYAYKCCCFDICNKATNEALPSNPVQTLTDLTTEETTSDVQSNRKKYKLSPEIVAFIRENNIPSDCRFIMSSFLCPDDNAIKQGFDLNYSDLIIGNSNLETKPCSLDPDNGEIICDIDFSRGQSMMILWTDAEHILRNLVIRLRESGFSKIGTAKDLSGKWKCKIIDLERLKELCPVEDGLWRLRDPSTSKFIFESASGECFSDLTGDAQFSLSPELTLQFRCEQQDEQQPKTITWTKLGGIQEGNRRIDNIKRALPRMGRLQFKTIHLFTGTRESLQSNVDEFLSFYVSKLKVKENCFRFSHTLDSDVHGCFRRININSPLQPGGICIFNMNHTDGEGEKISLQTLIQNINGHLQWVNINLEPVSTPLESHLSIVAHYAQTNGISLDPEGRFGYTLSQEVADILRQGDVSGLKLAICEETEEDAINRAYTLFLLGISPNDTHHTHFFKLSESLDKIYLPQFVPPIAKMFLIWEDKNVIVQLQENGQFNRIGVASGLSEQWKCDVQDLAELKGLFKGEDKIEVENGWYISISNEPNGNFILVDEDSGQLYSDLDRDIKYKYATYKTRNRFASVQTLELELEFFVKQEGGRKTITWTCNQMEN